MSNHNLEVYLSSLKLLHPNSTANQNTTKITRTEPFIAKAFCSTKQDQTKVGLRTSNISYFIHTERTKFGLLRLAYRTHTTRIFLEESGLSYRPAGWYSPAWLIVQSGRRIWNQIAAGPLPNQRTRRFSCWYSSLFIIARALSYINLAGVLGVRT